MRRVAAVVALVAATLVISGCRHSGWYALARLGSGHAIARDSGVVKVFASPTVSAVEVTRMRSELAAVDGVSSVEFTSAEAALQRAKQLFADSPDVIDDLAGNPFPPSFELQLADDADIDEVIAAASKIDGVVGRPQPGGGKVDVIVG